MTEIERAVRLVEQQRQVVVNTRIDLEREFATYLEQPFDQQWRLVCRVQFRYDLAVSNLRSYEGYLQRLQGG